MDGLKRQPLRSCVSGMNYANSLMSETIFDQLHKYSFNYTVAGGVNLLHTQCVGGGARGRERERD